MSINGISTGYLVGYGYNIKTVNTRGSSFTERIGENVVTDRNNQTIGNQSYNRTVNQTASMDTYLATAVQRCNEIPSLKELFPMETANYKIEDSKKDTKIILEKNRETGSFLLPKIRKEMIFIIL